MTSLCRSSQRLFKLITWSVQRPKQVFPMKHTLKSSLLAIALASISTSAFAEPSFNGDGWNSPNLLFAAKKYNTDGYRIPAITLTSQGTLIAFADFREFPQYDIGGKPNGKDQTIDMAYRVSYDQGETWSEINRFDAKHLDAGFKQICDPSIVHDPVSGKTFAFGFAANGSLANSTTHGMIMYTSTDGGATWDKGQNIYNAAINPGYTRVLQGPGKGMYYNDTIYMAVQSWKGNGSGGDPFDPIAGFIYSEDHGKTWKQAYLNDIDGKGTKGPKTSESHVFHHKGYVYLAAKSEDSSHAQRFVFRTKDNGKTWEEVVEDFFPEGVERCESSTIALSDDVYLVGYAMNGRPTVPRKDVYLTTNTGKKILIGPGDTMGYTSLDMDEDNIYVLFEGGERFGNMWFQKFDHASKDYANLAQQILDRADDGKLMQGMMNTDSSYIKGSYGNIDAGLEAVYAGPLFNVGVFYKETDENSKDRYRTIEYDTKDITLAASINGIAVESDSIFAAVQSSNIDYVNNAEADVVSGMLGYQAKFDVNGFADYKLNVLGIYSEYDFSRNNKEGIGRKADFASYSFSVENALSKTLEFTTDADATFGVGLRSTLFGHDGFTEQGGNNWNNADVKKSMQNSHQIFAGADFKYKLQAGPNVDVLLKTGAEFSIELADVEEYREEYTVLDVTKKMALPIEDHTDGFAKAYVGTDFIINKAATVGLYASADTDSEKEIRASLGWKF